METLTFVTPPAFRRRILLLVLVQPVVAAIAGAVIYWLWGGNRNTITAAILVSMIVFVVLLGWWGFHVVGSNFTVCDADGIRCRALGRYHDWLWSEIRYVQVRERQTRSGRARQVYVGLTDGGTVALVVPASSTGRSGDPDFDRSIARIKEFHERYA